MKVRSVLECGSPLPLWLERTAKHDAADVPSTVVKQSARGQAQSKTWRSLAAALACLSLCLLAPSLLAGPLTGGDFSLEGGPVAGGGAAAGGTFAVDASAGETATGALSGGTFEVTGGLIGVAVAPGDVILDFETHDGQVTLTWSAAADYVLEFTSVISDAAPWQPVTPAPANHTFTTPFNQPLRCFRLHKP